MFEFTLVDVFSLYKQFTVLMKLNKQTDKQNPHSNLKIKSTSKNIYRIKKS